MDSIQFLTRKNATCQDMLSCLYNLKTIDLEVFRATAQKEWATLDQIAENVKRDRSSTHRSLSKLQSAGLIHKQSRGLKGGGYYHIYNIVEPERIKENAKQKVAEITTSLEELIDKFETELVAHIASNVR